MSIEDALGVINAKNEDLILLKNSNFKDFIDFIPKELVERYIDIQAVKFPGTQHEQNFKIWIKRVTKRIGKTQIQIAAACRLEETKYSKYLNDKYKFDDQERNTVRDYLITELRNLGFPV